MGTTVLRQSGFTSRNSLADDGSGRDRYGGASDPEWTSRRIKNGPACHGQPKCKPSTGYKGRNAMSRKVSRRKFMAGTAAGAAAAAFKFPAPAIAQAAPFKLGLLTIKTGPLAQGGIQIDRK